MIWWFLQGATRYAMVVGILGLVVSGWLEKRRGLKAAAPVHWPSAAVLAFGPALGVAALWATELDGEVRSLDLDGRERAIVVLAHGSERRVRVDNDQVRRCAAGNHVVKPSRSFALSCEGQPVDLDLDMRLLVVAGALAAATITSVPYLRRRPTGRDTH